jgi:HEAT repeat protein
LTAALTVLTPLVLAATLCAQGTGPQDATAPTTQQILKDLDSSNYQKQRRAVLAARKVKEPAILEKLLQLAVHARHPNIKGYACETLGHYRDPRIFPLLREAVTSGPPSTRMGALPGLGLLRDRRSYQLLARALKDQRSNWSYAATGLHHLGDKRGAEPLADVFRKHLHDHAVFGAVAEAILALDRDRAVDLFFAAIQDPKTFQHHRLDRLLGQVKTKDVRGRAQKLLAHEDLRVQRTGLRILGGCGDVGTVAVLLKVMDSDETLRLEAIRAIGELKHELAVPQVARYLSADSADERAVVAEALGKIGHGTAVRSLVLALHAEEEIIPRLRMIEALGLTRDKQAVAELGRHLTDETLLPQPMTMSSIASFPYNTPVSWAAWWAIACIRDSKPPQPLRQMFRFLGQGKQVKKSDIESATKWWQEHRHKPGFSLQK